MNILAVGILIAAAFLVQAVMGFFQIRNFAKNFDELRQQGRVLIGKNPRRTRAGSLMLLCLDEEDRIQQIKLMKGMTVFSRFRDLSGYEGRYLPELAADHDVLQQMPKTEREVLLNAYRNFVNFRTNNLSFSDFDTSGVNFLELPVFAGMATKAHGLWLNLRQKTTKQTN